MNAQRPSRSRALVSRAALVAVLAGTAALVTACGQDGDARSAEAAPTGMAHVHGLGIDPADGQLVAGTHYGAFRVGEDGRVEQTGPVQDFMGFTVVGPGHYLASGHPGAGQDAPGNLGLLESTDAGRTWETVSLRGEADFHTLEARHGRVYGHSAGRLMVSQDRRTWEERATIPLADLAISPQDSDTLLATTAQGPARSTDGGRTFAPVAGAPLLVLVTWTEGGTLIGVDPQGSVHASEDGGDTWTRRGSAGGQPTALTATDDAVAVATADGSIVESRDGGATFRTRYRA